MKKHFLCFLLSIASFFPTTASAVCGKVDMGYMHMDVDIITNNVKTRHLTMDGFASNGTIQLYSCLVTKPTVMFAEGEGNYYSLGNNFGVYLPYKCFSITPSAGGGYSSLRFDSAALTGGLFSYRQKVISRSVNVAVDLSYEVMDCLTLSGTIQYAWVNSRTTFGRLANYKAESKGFNYVAMVDYYLNDCVSLNLTGAWQSSRDKERHGSDGRGIRLGMGYTF